MNAESRRTLSEAESKEMLASFGVPFARESRAQDALSAREAAEAIGFPVALKLNGDAIAHKTERGLVRLGLSDPQSVQEAAEDLLARARPEDGEVDLLVAEMIAGQRELIAGLVRDPQFGACVVLGLGGVLTEALGDAVFAAAPLTREDAESLVDGLENGEWLTKAFRGEPPLDPGAARSRSRGVSGWVGVHLG